MTVLNLQVSSGADDVLTGPWDALVEYYFPRTGGNDYNAAFRWNNVTVPNAATITSAIFSFYSVASGSQSPFDAPFKFQDADNAGAFASSADFNARSWTSTVAWTMDYPYPLNQFISAPEAKTIFQTVVNRVGWVSGNSVALTTTTGPTAASNCGIQWRSYTNSPSNAAKLDITYLAAAPTVSNVTANSGPAAGGTNVTITGTNFVATPTVTFGGTAATNVAFVNSTTITCTTPSHAAGAVDVVVTNPDTQAGTGTGAFTYVAPAISDVYGLGLNCSLGV